MVSKTVLAAVVVVALLMGGVLGYLFWEHSDRPTGTQVWPYGSPMAGRGPMGGYCPMCGRPWNGMGSAPVEIPDTLEKPQSQDWISRLRDVLSCEKLSYAQYTADAEKYDVWMPYNRVIPQENDHIEWINQLFSAYRVDANADTPPIKRTDTVEEAFETARMLEQDLIPRYEWLIDNTRDETTREVLDNILFQTRMHYMMFTHASQRGRMGMHR